MDTDDADLMAFLSSLHPVDCGLELIRIGGGGDGGYLIPNDLDGIVGCFSPGVSTVADFEKDLADLGIECYLADASVDEPPIKNLLFTFDKKFLGASNNNNYMTLQFWVNKYAKHSRDLILQMDIEGGEFEVLLETCSDTLKRFRIIVIEFHCLEGILKAASFEYIKRSFEKLLSEFSVLHIHPNNCCGSIKSKDYDVPRVMEFTFLRNDRILKKSYAKLFPHPLDRKNVASGDDLVLPKCWYSSS